MFFFPVAKLSYPQEMEPVTSMLEVTEVTCLSFRIAQVASWIHTEKSICKIKLPLRFVPLGNKEKESCSHSTTEILKLPYIPLQLCHHNCNIRLRRTNTVGFLRHSAKQQSK